MNIQHSHEFFSWFVVGRCEKFHFTPPWCILPRFLRNHFWLHWSVKEWISNEGAGNQHIQECGNLVLLPHGIPSTMLSVSNVSCDGESGKFKANADNIGWQGAVISRVFKHVWGTKEMAKTTFIFNRFQMVKVVKVNVPFSPIFFCFCCSLLGQHQEKKSNGISHHGCFVCTGASGTTKARYWGDVGNITLKLGISKHLENRWMNLFRPTAPNVGRYKPVYFHLSILFVLWEDGVSCGWFERTYDQPVPTINIHIPILTLCISSYFLYIYIRI